MTPISNATPLVSSFNYERRVEETRNKINEIAARMGIHEPLHFLSVSFLPRLKLSKLEDVFTFLLGCYLTTTTSRNVLAMD